MDGCLSKHLNLNESTVDDIPNDFYGVISNLLKTYFKNKLSDKNLTDIDRNMYKRLSELTIQRNIIKKTIMTIPYNASMLSGIKYLKEGFVYDGFTVNSNESNCNDNILLEKIDNKYDEELNINNDLDNLTKESSSKSKSDIRYEIWYRNIKDENVRLQPMDFVCLCKAIHYVLNHEFVSLKILVDYLKKVGEICSILQISIPWLLPTGLIAIQSYMKIKNIRFQPLNFSNKKFLLKIADHNTYDKSKQIRSLMPNLIHSLDATSLILLLQNYFNSSNANNIYAIHDCFASTANNMTKIIDILKISYISLYGDEKYLIKFDENIITTIKKESNRRRFRHKEFKNLLFCK